MAGERNTLRDHVAYREKIDGRASLLFHLHAERGIAGGLAHRWRFGPRSELRVDEAFRCLRELSPARKGGCGRQLGVQFHQQRSVRSFRRIETVFERVFVGRFRYVRRSEKHKRRSDDRAAADDAPLRRDRSDPARCFKMMKKQATPHVIRVLMCCLFNVKRRERTFTSVNSVVNETKLQSSLLYVRKIKKQKNNNNNNKTIATTQFG